MDIPSFQNLLDLDFDLEKRTLTIRLGPLKITGISLPDLRSLRNNNELIGQMLSDSFITRRVMWIDLTREVAKNTALSLDELAGILKPYRKKFENSSRRIDREIGPPLLAWENQCRISARNIRDAIETERLPENTGIDGYASEVMDDEIVLVRKVGYPIIELLGAILDATSLRQQVETLLVKGRQTLISEYRVLLADLPRADVDIGPQPSNGNVST
ncbi:hypothetical protein WL51_03555 [Burkholderia ubonensis]|uniref:hypothetical protein n=1 Tax=Burkholderia ubonensis TaxID=101571 RepID=UPI00075DFF80|nr:hypothetical protein [Burkholderia ubonensis]KWC42426.1 hypothetical protein WL51_03555 [Burkholderia ubonensis]